MKKSVLFFTVSAILFSCAPKDQYTIQGAAEGMDEGQNVILSTYDNDTEMSDTAKIKNGKFSFQGKIDAPGVYYISTDQSEINRPLLLEAGKILVNITGKQIKITGTPINDAYQKSLDANIPLEDRMIEIKKEHDQAVEDSVMTDELDEKLKNEFYQLADKIQEEKVNFIGANLTNPLGEQLFLSEARRLPLDKLSALMDKTSEAFKAKEQVKPFMEIIDAYNNTAINKNFTDLTLKDPSGKDVSLSEYAGKGKYVLIDFWASWCGPCREEMPVLVELYKKYKNKNFEIVGISLDNKQDAWVDGIKALNITWPQISDLGRWESIAAKKYAINSIPQTILLDPNGVIIAKGLRGDELVKKLEEVIQ